MKPSIYLILFGLLLPALPALAASEAGKPPCSVLEELILKISKLSGRLPISDALNKPLHDAKLRLGGWRYRIDDQKGMWLSGRSNYSRGVTEIYYRTPKRVAEQEQFIVMTDYLRDEGLSTLPENKVGLAIHFDSEPDPLQVFQIIDQSRLNDPAVQAELTEALRALPQDYREYVLRGYAERLKMDAATRQKLRKISKDAEGRSILFVKTREPQALWRDQENEVLFYQDAAKRETAWGEAKYPLGRTHPDHFTIEGGAIVVTSSSEEELLPLEALTGFRVPRKPGEKIAEIGRFFVGKNAHDETSPRLLALMASTIVNSQKIDRLIIEADAVRARHFKKYGFVPIHEQINYEGKVEYIMEVTPEAFFKANAERLLADLPEPATLPRLAPTEEADFYTHAENHLIPGDKDSPIVAIGGSLASQLLTRLRDMARSDHSIELKRVEMRREIYKSQAFFKRLSAKDADDFARDVLKAADTEKGVVEAFRNFLKSHRFYDLLERYFPTSPFIWMQQDFEEIRTAAISRDEKILRLEVLMKLDSRIIKNFGYDGIVRMAEHWLDLKDPNVSADQLAKVIYREIRFGN